MEKEKLLQKMQDRLAEISVSGSTLRNQGAARMVATAREFLKQIDLQAFKECIADKQSFNQFLDNRTEDLVTEFKKLEGFKPNEGKGFGAARKSLNLFFREVVYNTFLAERLNLPMNLEHYNQAIQFLEIPLDKDAADGIYEKCKLYKIEAKGLPEKWPRIIHLTPEISKTFQEAALEIAKKEKTARVHLDLIFWRLNAEASNNI